MNQTLDWDEVKKDIENEIAEIGVKRGEFVVSAMTKAVANSMDYFLEHSTEKKLPALDIGTGTAYHTALLLSKAYHQVVSVDINPQAIIYAKERIKNYLPHIPQFEEANFEKYLSRTTGLDQSVNFYNYDLDTIAEKKDMKYALASFNPPILYPFHKITYDKPATNGVYFENENIKDERNDLVYRLYKTIAQQNLKKGSHLLCIWANLNRHLVEINPFQTENPEYVHPARILENWFDFQFDNEAESFEDFYCHKTILGAGFFNQSETGKLYSANIRQGIENNSYSKLLIPSKEENLAGTYFHFGVLHLEKTSDTENRFKIINGSSRG
jgi:SAM-dependent methyltransferase